MANDGFAEGASSNATTIPGSDADAVENARRGCAQAKELEVAQGASAVAPSTTARPNLLRVNSVPVLSPHTPVDRIRRTSTPKLAEPPQSGSSTQENTPEESQNGTSPVEEGGATKPKKLVNKKKKRKARMQSAATHATKPQPNNEQEQPTANKEASGTDNTPPTTDGNPSEALASGNAAAPADKTGDDNASALAPSAGPVHQPKPAATKSMPKKPDHNAVKEQKTPARTDSLDDLQRQQAEANNLRRLNTAQQHTPREGPDHEMDDLEALLDKEIKREPNAAIDSPSPEREVAPPAASALALPAEAPPTVTSDPAAPVEVEAPAPPPTPPRRASALKATAAAAEPKRVTFDNDATAPAPAEPTKTRPAKTPEQKAAHARYVRFSRSFQRILH